MKNAVTSSHVAVRGNLDISQAQRMTIDEDGMVIVMGLLSNLYSNGNEAVVREYACNARDSHVEAGQRRPIEVSLPTPLNPQFQVQDYGLGLSRDEIFSVYAKYGASTKRASNDQIGAFGIGAKSAFTVGNQFTVTGVKDGEKTIVMFAKRSDGTPTVQELFHGETDEPNGVLVDVGVENVDAVCRAAEKIFVCWRSGTVLVDGQPPDSLWDNTEQLAEGIHVDWTSATTGYGGNHIKLIMGGVPYAIPAALWNDTSPLARQFATDSLRTSITYILEVPIGKVDITPNREELHITPRTRSTVGRMVELAANSLGPWVTQKISSAPTIWEAAKSYHQVATKLNYRATNVYWNNELIVDQIHLKRRTFTLDRKGWAGGGGAIDYRVMSGDDWFTQLGHGGYANTLFVVNVPDDKLNIVRAHAKRVLFETDKKHLVTIDTPGYRESWFSVGEGADHAEIDFLHFKDFWEKGKQLRKSAAVAGTANRTRYQTYMKGDKYRELRTVEEISDLDPKVVALGTYAVFNPNNSVHKEILEEQDVLFVNLSSRQKSEVFKRSFPNAVDARELIMAHADSIVKKMTPDDKRIINAASASHSLSRAPLDFIRANRLKITNKVVLDRAEEITKALNFSDQDSERYDYLVYAIDSSSAPRLTRVESQDMEFFTRKLPLLRVGLRNELSNANLVGGKSLLTEALIDYVNNTPVAPI